MQASAARLRAAPHSRAWTRRAILATIAVLIGAYYWWAVRASGDPLFWGYDLSDYYDLLGRGFASGHLYLPLDPDPRLLALPNPWDPSVDPSLKLHDAVLYHGRYYLYFGAAPAVLLFTPWRLITGHDLPQRAGIFILAFAGFLFACGALLRVLDLASVRPGPLLLAVLAIGLGLCQSVPYLLNRVAAYEIAIAGGYFCLSAAVFFLARGIGKDGQRDWLAAAGLLYGCAAGSRPHLMFAGFIAAAGLILFLGKSKGLGAAIRSREVRAFVVPFALVGLALALYNYERFGNPFEFGIHYQLAGPGQNRIELAARNLLPGSYYMLLAPPLIGPVFPWMRIVWHYIFNSPESYPFPPEYFVEPTVGALWLAPLILAAPFVLFRGRAGREANLIVGIASLSSLVVLLFLISTHLTAQRYETDFIASGIFAAVAGLGIRICRSRGWTRVVAGAALAVVVAYGSAANLALGFAGPYDDILKNRPASYVRIARWFSPTPKSRPKIDPEIAIDLRLVFSPQAPGYREPLISIGHSHYAYSLFVERAGDVLRFASDSDESEKSYEMPFPGDRPVALRLSYSPRTHILTEEIDGEKAIAQPISMLISAPADIKIGDNPGDLGRAGRRFSGAIQILREDFR
ncbi:MAG TPA: hypothetical protein VH639_04765 [Bryobacteraceae bacterium]